MADDKLLGEREIRAKLRDIDAQIDDLRRKRDGWRLILEGHRMIEGGPQTPQGEVVSIVNRNRPGIKEAVLRVMAEDAEREWTTDEIWRRLESLEWVPVGSANPRQNMGATLSRLTNKDRLVQRTDDGTYKLRVIPNVGDAT